MALPEKPPPLQWLPVFEAVARHLSVKRAAEELHVTPSAISQQLKALEHYLGLSLLHRSSKGVNLTEAGRYYLPFVQDVLDAHRRAHAQLKGRFNQGQLRVSMDPLMANELIIPRLREFSARHPDINLRIETSMHNVDFESDPADAAIRCTQHIDKGLHGELVSRCFGNVIMSADAQRTVPIADVSDLVKHAWITFTPAANEWGMLCVFLGMEPPREHRMLHFDNIVSAVAAVEQGLGIMIGLFPLMKRLVDSGRIVTASPHSVEIPLSHYVVCRSADRDRREIQLFSAWCRDVFSS